jgi:flagellar protein FliJ
MQKFRFKLQRLLDFRKIREGQAEVEFAKATRVFLHEKEMLRKLEFTLGKMLDGLKQEQVKCSSLLILKMFQEYIDTTREGIKLQTIKVAAAADRRQRCLRVYEEAARKRKGVDTLLDKKLLQYQEQVLREEQSFLDELSGQRYIRDS